MMYKLLAVLCLLLIGTGSARAATGASAPSNDEELYYAADKTFANTNNWELRLGGGYDFSNPYLHIYSGQLAAYWLFDPSVAFGIEGSTYDSRRRDSAITLANAMAAKGVNFAVINPQWSAVGVLRVTPISGLVNLFSSRVLKADINLVLRAGTIQYQNIGMGPVIGTGLEVHLGITPSWGFLMSVVWDAEKPDRQDWQWNSGFRVGPTFRF